MGGLQACALTTRHREAGTLRSRAPRLEDDGARPSSSGKAVAARMLACRFVAQSTWALCCDVRDFDAGATHAGDTCGAASGAHFRIAGTSANEDVIAKAAPDRGK